MRSQRCESTPDYNATLMLSSLGKSDRLLEILAFSDFGVENLVELIKIHKDLKSRHEP